VARLIVLPSSSYRWQPITVYSSPSFFRAKRSTSIVCDTGLIPIGTRVHVTGDIQSVSRFEAKRLTVYAVPLQHAVSKGLSTSSSKASTHTDQPRSAENNLKDSCDTTVPKTLQLGYGEPVSTVQSKRVQEYVSELGMGLVRQAQAKLPNSSTPKILFRFYVVQSSKALSRKKFSTIDGALPYNISDYGRGEYVYRKPTYYRLAEDNTIALQNGIILIPDRALARLQNHAQLAALLAYSIASILQDNILETALVVESTSPDAMNYRFGEALRLNQQVLRLGIQLMYQSGYDIREAPFAWTVAQAEPVNNPVINTWHPDRKIPWYAAYAFIYISHHYQNVDYTKLQRGEKEYRQFLKDLYKSDPAQEPSKVQTTKQ
ncbi:MAG: M48 family metalloprotease, partial [Acidobacteriaceae bacterium]